ncbi:MAG: hypothetical protein IJR13_10365 [Bacteroidales bacterium]|nr:hypothetical protein [Bacteroidales bacterium]
MRKFFLLIVLAFTMASCGGTYSVASGRDDAAQLSFAAAQSSSIVVFIDGTQYDMETVKQVAYRQRKMKATAKNTITIATGQHNVKVVSNGETLYEKQIFVSTGQHKVIEL